MSEHGRASSFGTPTQFQGSRQAAQEMRQIIADSRAFKRAVDGSARAV
jgi:hypothetical protein